MIKPENWNTTNSLWLYYKARRVGDRAGEDTPIQRDHENFLSLCTQECVQQEPFATGTQCKKHNFMQHVIIRLAN